MKKVNLWIGLISLALGLGTFARSASTTIYDEVFSGSRTTQNLPTQAYWYNSQNNSQITASSGSLSVVANSTYINLAYFTTSGSPVTLGVGDSLVFNYTFTATGIMNQGNGWRMALLNSGGSRVTADGYNVGNAAFNGNTGYGVFTDLGITSATESHFIYRPGGNDTLLAGSGYVQYATGFTGANLTSGQEYSGSFSVKNNGTSVTLTYMINGNTYTETDSTHLYTSFDMVALQLVTQAASVSFSNLEVTYISAIPEPSVTVLSFFGGLVLAVAGWRKFSKCKAV